MQPMTIALIPVDTSRLPKMPADGPQIPKPSIEHSLTTCDGCGEDCWIGPGQKIQRVLRGGMGLCYYCLFRTMQADNGWRDFHIVAADADADSKPRRT